MMGYRMTVNIAENLISLNVKVSQNTLDEMDEVHSKLFAIKDPDHLVHSLLKTL